MNNHNLKRTSDLRFLQYTLSGSFTRSAISNIYIFCANFVALFSGQKCNNFDSSKTKKHQIVRNDIFYVNAKYRTRRIKIEEFLVQQKRTGRF